jgi:ABC-type transport system involved in multi-copper enzyme maturation permease subunit
VINLIPAEIRRQTGRRGSFFGSLAFVTLFGLGVLLVIIFSHDDTSAKTMSDGTGVLYFAIALASIVIGATAGAYDTDQGTMRYLVLTGRPRWQLMLVRVPGLMVTIILVSLPAVVLVILASLISPSPRFDGGDLFDLFWTVWMVGFLYGIFSLAIGTFLKSNGVAIAVSVVMVFGGFLIAGLIYSFVSKDLANAFFPIVVSVVVDRKASPPPDPSLSLGASSAILVVWLSVLLGAALARVQRAEY